MPFSIPETHCAQGLLVKKRSPSFFPNKKKRERAIERKAFIDFFLCKIQGVSAVADGSKSRDLYILCGVVTCFVIVISVHFDDLVHMHLFCQLLVGFFFRKKLKILRVCTRVLYT